MGRILIVLTLRSIISGKALRSYLKNSKMKMIAPIFVALVGTIVVNLDCVNSSPAIATNYDALEICIENCAQCKRMFGDWFEGPRCAEFCIKYRGKVIPECENLSSISSFINGIKH